MIMTDRQSVAANATVQNAISGKTMEYLAAPSRVRVGINAAAIGLFATVIIGTNVVLEDQEVSSINRFPQDPEDFILDEPGLPGDRIVVKLRNSTGAAIITFSAVKVTPV